MKDWASILNTLLSQKKKTDKIVYAGNFIVARQEQWFKLDLSIAKRAIRLDWREAFLLRHLCYNSFLMMMLETSKRRITRYF